LLNTSIADWYGPTLSAFAYLFKKVAMHSQIVRQFRMEASCKQVALSHSNGVIAHLRENFDPSANLFHPRSANKDRVK
jgi:anthranilate/para-aminobenzoate synthase component II